MKLKNFTAALKDANEVLKMDPTNEKALYRRITCHKEMRMYEEVLHLDILSMRFVAQQILCL